MNTPASHCAFPVNLAHQRGIGVTLTLVDSALCRIDEWANGRETQSVLHREQNNLTEDQRAAIKETTDQMRRLIEELARTFNVHGSVQDAASTVRGECAGVWEPLVEMLTKHLRRYGDLPEGLAEYLDPKTEQLIQGIEHILDILRNPEAASPDDRPH